MTGQRHEAVFAQLQLHRLEVVLASEKRRQQVGQIVQRGGRVQIHDERMQPRELVPQTRRNDLVRDLRLAEVLEAVRSQIAQRDIGRQCVAQQERRRVRHEDLLAVTDRRQTRDAVDGRAEVVAARFDRGPGVDPHPDAHRCDRRRPGAVAQAPLRIERGLERVFRAQECGAKGVADGLEDHAAVPFDGLAKHRVMTGERGSHHLAVALPELRAALDVGEQEGHRAGRKRCRRGYAVDAAGMRGSHIVHPPA